MARVNHWKKAKGKGSFTHYVIHPRSPRSLHGLRSYLATPWSLVSDSRPLRGEWGGCETRRRMMRAVTNRKDMSSVRVLRHFTSILLTSHLPSVCSFLCLSRLSVSHGRWEYDEERRNMTRIRPRIGQQSRTWWTSVTLVISVLSSLSTHPIICSALYLGLRPQPLRDVIDDGMIKRMKNRVA